MATCVSYGCDAQVPGNVGSLCPGCRIRDIAWGGPSFNQSPPIPEHDWDRAECQEPGCFARVAFQPGTPAPPAWRCPRHRAPGEPGYVSSEMAQASATALHEMMEERIKATPPTGASPAAGAAWNYWDPPAAQAVRPGRELKTDGRLILWMEPKELERLTAYAKVVERDPDELAVDIIRDVLEDRDGPDLSRPVAAKAATSTPEDFDRRVPRRDQPAVATPAQLDAMVEDVRRSVAGAALPSRAALPMPWDLVEREVATGLEPGDFEGAADRERAAIARGDVCGCAAATDGQTEHVDTCPWWARHQRAERLRRGRAGYPDTAAGDVQFIHDMGVVSAQAFNEAVRDRFSVSSDPAEPPPDDGPRRRAQTEDPAVDRELAWLRRGLAVARLVATWSKDPSTQVGAVLMDEDHRILGTGFNGFPRGVGDHPERYEVKAIKYPMVVHAEANALIAALGAGAASWSVTLIVTAAPCARCVGLAIQAGVSAIAYPDPAGDPRMDREPWKSEAKLARTMLEEAGVKVVLL